MTDIQKKYFYKSMSDSALWQAFLQDNSTTNPTLLTQIESECTLYLKQARKNNLIKNIRQSCLETYEKYPILVSKTKIYFL